jgi:hypothetical protein
MKSPQKSYLIPPQFARLTPLMVELELQYSVIDSLDPGDDDRLKRAKTEALKTLEHGLLTIYDEVVYIHRCTTNKLKIKRGKEVELSSCYLKVLEIAVDLFIHKENWGAWYKMTMDKHRAVGKHDKFAPNNLIYKNITLDLEKLLGRKLAGTDYPLWVQTLRDKHPVPPVVTKTRNSNKKSNTPKNPIEGAPLIERESPWPESTARKKFKELTGCNPTKKGNNSSIK